VGEHRRGASCQFKVWRRAPEWRGSLSHRATLPPGRARLANAVLRTPIGKGAVRTAPKRELKQFLLGRARTAVRGKNHCSTGVSGNRTENRTARRTQSVMLISNSIIPQSVRHQMTPGSASTRSGRVMSCSLPVRDRRRPGLSHFAAVPKELGYTHHP
jgi:hypothetical protein